MTKRFGPIRPHVNLPPEFSRPMDDSKPTPWDPSMPLRKDATDGMMKERVCRVARGLDIRSTMASRLQASALVAREFAAACVAHEIRAAACGDAPVPNSALLPPKP